MKDEGQKEDIVLSNKITSLNSSTKNDWEYQRNRKRIQETAAGKS